MPVWITKDQKQLQPAMYVGLYGKIAKEYVGNKEVVTSIFVIEVFVVLKQ